MERAFASSSTAAAVAVVTATALLALCCAAARPLGPQEAVTSTEVATLAGQAWPPAASTRYDGAAAMAGKWLPYTGSATSSGGFPHHHLPAAFWAHRPVPSVGGGLGEGARGGTSGGAFEGAGGEEELVRGRERERSYERGESDLGRQEQLAMWASLLNPKGKRREANGWLPGEGVGEAADQEPAKMSDGAAEGTALDDPTVGGLQVDQTKSGLYWGNNGN